MLIHGDPALKQVQGDSRNNQIILIRDDKVFFLFKKRTFHEHYNKNEFLKHRLYPKTANK